jgi:cytochrome bd-type quinol oxidase subunit 2
LNHGAEVWLVLMVTALAANLPFMSQRLLIVGPARPAKPWAWRLLELALLAALSLGFGLLLENRIGQRFEQGWQFYAAFACLFLTLAFPGFVWRQLRRHRTHG